MYMTIRVDGDNGLLPKRDNDPTAPGARPGAESDRVGTPVSQSHARMSGPKRSMDILVLYDYYSRIFFFARYFLNY